MDPDRLRAYLSRRMRLHGPPTALVGGRDSALYTFTAADTGSSTTRTFVLKLYRGPGQATREWHALTRLHAADHPVPRGVLLEPDARHLGRPFVVMEHVAGRPFWHVYERADAATRTRLARRFVATLVELHELRPDLLEPDTDASDPYRWIDRELGRLRRDGDDSPHPGVVDVVRWLEQRRTTVPCARPSILHRDHHPWNVLVDTAGELRVIDWDWEIGDARFDVAWTTTLMRRSDFHAFADAVLDEYARRRGRLDGLAYFEVLTTVRWLLNVCRSVESDELSADARADFADFLTQPIRRATALLRERTGVVVTVRPWSAS